MKQFFVLAATCLLALACNNKAVNVTDPDSDLDKIVEASAGDAAKATEQASDFITEYVKALAAKLITQEQFDAFVAGLSEKANVPAETVKSLVETAKAAIFGTTEEIDSAAGKAADEVPDIVSEQAGAAADVANDLIDQVAKTTEETVKQGAADLNDAIGNALKQ